MAIGSFGSPDDNTPVFVISVAAQLAGMHAQTLRQYDRLGLVRPERTQGGGRRYSAQDIARLRQVQRLSQEDGISLVGIQRIMELENENDALRAKVQELSAVLRQVEMAGGRRVFAVGPAGDVMVVRPGERVRGQRAQELVLWQSLPH